MNTNFQRSARSQIGAKVVFGAKLDFYGMAEPAYEPQCTYKLYKKKLNVLCDECGIELNHHNALSDALACAELYLRHLRG